MKRADRIYFQAGQRWRHQSQALLNTYDEADSKQALTPARDYLSFFDSIYKVFTILTPLKVNVEGKYCYLVR